MDSFAYEYMILMADVVIALRTRTSSNVHRLYNATVRDLSCVRFDIFQQLVGVDSAG
jgi:hypothetical protein